jgi:hypothetical protein
MARMLCELSLDYFIIQSDIGSFVDILKGVAIVSEKEINESH